ncbi:hypothetical protein AgCh_038281 [Apium graveolens]
MLTDSSGDTHTSHEKISEVAVDHFRSMLGSNAHVNDFPGEIELPDLLNEHKDLLTAPFTEFDMLSTLKHLAKYKCPRPDGLPIEFFLASWEVIGTDVTNDGKPLLQGHDISGLLSLTDTSNLENVESWMDNGNWELPNLNHTNIIELRRRIGAVRIR